jgi:hypothetical protein
MMAYLIVTFTSVSAPPIFGMKPPLSSDTTVSSGASGGTSMSSVSLLSQPSNGTLLSRHENLSLRASQHPVLQVKNHATKSRHHTPSLPERPVIVELRTHLDIEM